MSASEPAMRIDALGRKCPMPIIMLARQIGQVPVGGLVEVLADDPAAKSDVPAWCGLKSHEFIGTTAVQAGPGRTGGWAFLVRRSY
jgi:tRNA 2-thiouridine synthesizing protein A